MAEIVTGTIGNEDVELNNAATEVTLAKILSQTRVNSQYLRELAKKAGVDVKNINDAFERNERAANAATKGTDALRERQEILSNSLKVSVSVLDAFGQKLIEGTAKTTDLYSALGKSAASFSDLGGGLGKVAAGLGIFFEGLSRVAAFQQKNLESYQQISSAGVNFSGSLTDLRLAAANSYMTLDQFSNLMKSNSQTFAKMGLTVNDGAKAFAHLSKELLSSEAGNSLLALGYTTDEVNSSMLSYINATGGRSRQELANTAAITAATTEYMTELDKLTQFSGVSRKQQEEDAKKAATNAAYQRALANMTEEQKARAEVARQAAANSGIAGAQDAFMSRIAGLPPVTDEAKQFVGTFGEAAGGVNDMAYQVKSTTGTMKGVEQGFGKFNGGISRQVNNLATAGDAMAMTGNKLINGASLYATQLIKGGKDTAEETAKAFGEISENQKKQQASQATEMTKANKGLQDLGIALINMINPIVVVVTPILSFVGQMLGKLGQGISFIMERLNSFGLVGKSVAIILSAVATAGLAMLAWKVKEFLFERSRSVIGGLAGVGGNARSMASAGGVGNKAGIAAMIESVGLALAALGPEALMIVAGAAAIGSSIALIGAGIAGATWLTGKALPTFAEGLEKFNKINGINLLKVSGGIAALGASMAAFSGLSLVSSLFKSGNDVFKYIVSFFGENADVLDEIAKLTTKLTPQIDNLTLVGTSLKIFGDGLSSTIRSLSSLSTFDIDKGDKLANLLNKLGKDKSVLNNLRQYQRGSMIAPSGKDTGGKDTGGIPRNIRNNNPGNIEYGDFARKMGAIGSDGRFAIFLTEEIGRHAQDALLKSKNYANLTAKDAIARWSPSADGNNPARYASEINKMTGIDMNRRYVDMSLAEKSKFLDAMKRVEGGISANKGPSSTTNGNIAGLESILAEKSEFLDAMKRVEGGISANKGPSSTTNGNIAGLESIKDEKFKSQLRSMVDDSSASTSPPMENSSPIQSDTENLHKEIKELNTQMAQVVKYLKDTADNTDKTHRATKALSGNGF